MLTHAKRDVVALLAAGGLSMILLAGCNTSEPDAKAQVANNETTPAESGESSAVKAKQTQISADTGKEKTVSSLEDLVNSTTPKTTQPSQLDPVERKLELQRQMAKARPASAGGFKVTAQPTSLDLGDIPLNEAKTGTIKLTNTSDTVMTIAQCKSSCGCTTSKCPEGLALQPGEHTEVEIRMTGGTSARQITKKVTFIVDGQDPMEVPVKAKAVAYVECVPERVAIDEMIGRPLTIRSIDGEQFTISRMVPAIATDFSTVPSAEHTLEIDWSRWDEVAGNRRRLNIYTDHPKNSRLSVFIQPSRASIANKTNQDIQDQIAKNAAVKQNLLDGAKQKEAEAKAMSEPATLLSLGNYDAFLKALEAGEFDPNARDRKDMPLINVAAEKDAIEVVEALLAAGANIESRDRISATPLMAAAKLGSPELVQLLLDSGANIRATDVIQNTALSWAAGFGKPGSVQVLIDAGADIEVSSGPVGFTPLIWAAGYGSPESVQILIDAGATVNARDTAQGATALMHAARTSELDSMAMLLSNGADLEARSHNDKTALLLAAESAGANVEVIRMLVEAGADITATDDIGRNALALVKNRTDPRAPAVQAYLETIIKE